MKNLKNLRLNDAKVLTSQEMKHLKIMSVLNMNILMHIIKEKT